jgi:mono/diheme cytochrome c family protein
MRHRKFDLMPREFDAGDSSVTMKTSRRWLLAATMLAIGACRDTARSAATARMPVVDLSAPTSGPGLYARYCVACHGAKGLGTPVGPAIASAAYLAANTDARLDSLISNGKAGTAMAAWGRMLKPEQIAAIVAHVRSMHPAVDSPIAIAPVEAAPPAASAPARPPATAPARTP